MSEIGQIVQKMYVVPMELCPKRKSRVGIIILGGGQEKENKTFERKSPMFEKEISYLKEEIIRLSVGVHICKREDLKEDLEKHLCALLKLWGNTLGSSKRVEG